MVHVAQVVRESGGGRVPRAAKGWEIAVGGPCNRWEMVTGGVDRCGRRRRWSTTANGRRDVEGRIFRGMGGWRIGLE